MTDLAGSAGSSTASSTATRSAAAGPLDGLVVLDLTQMLAGPFATMVLSDLGADVIKVESASGDVSRTVGPFLDDDAERTFSGYFASVNRGKRSIALDLKSPDGLDALRRIAARADVLVENFRAGVTDRLGIGYEAMAELNPRLVYASLTGFGNPRTGASPYADWPAFDITAQAFGGFMGITGEGPDRPLKAGPGIGDTVPGLFLAIGVLAGARQAEHTGRGCYVDVAMYDAVLALSERLVHQHAFTGEVPGPEGNSNPLLCPFDGFPATDGMVTIAAPADALWRVLAGLLGRAELADHPDYATLQDRVAHRDEVYRLIADWTGSRTKAEVLAVLGGHVPCAPVNDAAEIFADPHVAARRMIVPVRQSGTDHRAQVCGSPIKIAGRDEPHEVRAPRHGEDADAVLADLDFTPEEIAELRRSGALAPSTVSDPTREPSNRS